MDKTCQATRGVKELLDLKAEYLVPCVYHFYKEPPRIVSGEDVWLVDSEGRRYVDFYSGVTVMSAGHCNPAIIEPAIRQIRALQHTTTIYLTEPMLRLAERIARIAPGSLKKSFFCVSGSEAIEGALLTAVLHTGRGEVVAMTGALHGRTRWAMNVTGLSMWRTDPNPLEDVYHVSFGDIEALAEILSARGDRIAAVIAEPIQGNGGIVVPEESYWPAVRRLCLEHDVLLLFDEVQTGFNRTGKWFACEHWDVVPDILIVGKALGNGFPIAAFITSDEIAASYTRPGASTFGGNPVSAAAALATIDFHRTAGLDRRSEENGEYLLTRLNELAGERAWLANPRGKGLMLGVEAVDDGGAADPQKLDSVLEHLKDDGFLCGKTGPDRNVLTLMPPLTVKREHIERLCDSLRSYLDD